MKNQIAQWFRGRALRLIAVIGLLFLAVAAAWALALRRSANPRQDSPTGAPPEIAGNLDDLRPQVTAFCGDCHGTPAPAAFPKAAWHEEVKKGFDFYFDSGRNDLSPPDFDKVVAWFRSQAPEKVVISRPVESAIIDKLRFRVSSVAVGRDDEDPPAVSFVNWCALSPTGRPEFLWCDMRSGAVCSAAPLPRQSSSNLLFKSGHPAHAECCDLDGDGRVDVVVADLGSFAPSDHAQGKVVWLQRTGDSQRTGDAAWRPIVIQAGLGRVADVQPGDFDADGDVDLIVAEFGWRKTGRILLLENLGNAGAQPEFRQRELDPRHGAIHVPAVDLDGDGLLDFVALIGQEHETVVAFLNDGQGGFRKVTIFAANEPAFGSSGIQLVDLDRDGDLDVLYTNGDTFDSFSAKPFHSIRWLENRGTFPFEDHFLAAMPGVHRALACDLDGDGDLDIAACALLPERLFGRQSKDDFDSLLWLEQTAPGTFQRHSLERGTCQHAALAVGDFDSDGDIDLAVGRFAEQSRSPALGVWWNLRIDAGNAVDQAPP